MHTPIPQGNCRTHLYARRTPIPDRQAEDFPKSTLQRDRALFSRPSTEENNTETISEKAGTWLHHPAPVEKQRGAAFFQGMPREAKQAEAPLSHWPGWKSVELGVPWAWRERRRGAAFSSRDSCHRYDCRGLPHCGHTVACCDTFRPQFGQRLRLIPFFRFAIQTRRTTAPVSTIKNPRHSIPRTTQGIGRTFPTSVSMFHLPYCRLIHRIVPMSRLGNGGSSRSHDKA